VLTKVSGQVKAARSASRWRPPTPARQPVPGPGKRAGWAPELSARDQE